MCMLFYVICERLAKNQGKKVMVMCPYEKHPDDCESIAVVASSLVNISKYIYSTAHYV